MRREEKNILDEAETNKGFASVICLMATALVCCFFGAIFTFAQRPAGGVRVYVPTTVDSSSVVPAALRKG